MFLLFSGSLYASLVLQKGSNISGSAGACQAELPKTIRGYQGTTTGSQREQSCLLWTERLNRCSSVLLLLCLISLNCSCCYKGDQWPKQKDTKHFHKNDFRPTMEVIVNRKPFFFWYKHRPRLPALFHLSWFHLSSSVCHLDLDFNSDTVTFSSHSLSIQ